MLANQHSVCSRHFPQQYRQAIQLTKTALT